jgi:hypothetical protein
LGAEGPRFKSGCPDRVIFSGDGLLPHVKMPAWFGSLTHLKMPAWVG